MNSNQYTCRICLGITKESKLRSLFEEFSEIISVADLIFMISGISITLSSSLPDKICDKCFANVEIIRKFRLQCIKTEEILQHQIQKSTKSIIKEEDLSEFQDATQYLLPSLDILSQDEKEEEEEVKVELDDYEILPQDFFQDYPKTHARTRNNLEQQKPMKKKNSKRDKETSQRNKEVKEVSPCSYCGKICRTSQLLYSHEKTHLKKPDSKNYECDICGKSFAIRNYIFAHMINIHSVEKRFTCDTCGKAYSRIDSYKNHMANHLEVKPVKCLQCPKTFGSKKHLQIHYRVHTGERPYKCSYCPRTYAHYSDNKRHMMIHTGERPYVCEVCKKGFIKRSSLTTHQKTHYSATTL